MDGERRTRRSGWFVAWGILLVLGVVAVMAIAKIGPFAKADPVYEVRVVVTSEHPFNVMYSLVLPDGTQEIKEEKRLLEFDRTFEAGWGIGQLFGTTWEGVPGLDIDIACEVYIDGELVVQDQDDRRSAICNFVAED